MMGICSSSGGVGRLSGKEMDLLSPTSPMKLLAISAPHTKEHFAIHASTSFPNTDTIRQVVVSES